MHINKLLINYLGPSGDRTRYIQTEATPPGVQHASCHWNCVKKHNPNDMPEAALGNWQPVWNGQVSISTPVCVNFELRPGFGDIHICWFNCLCSGMGNAHKPTKEPINHRGPSGDRTHYLQKEHSGSIKITHIHTNIQAAIWTPGEHLLCGLYWGCASPKGHFLSPDSLAKGVFVAKIP